MEVLEATDPMPPFFLDQEKLQPLSTLGKIKLNDAEIAVAKHVQRMQNATTLSVVLNCEPSTMSCVYSITILNIVCKL